VGVDVAVVGGGPAGAAVATLLGSYGRSVLLIDRARFPRARIGESLPPKVEPLLQILGVAERVNAAGFARMRGTTVAQGRGITSHDFHPAGARLGYQVDRGELDRMLLERAREAGATVLEQAVFTGILREGERITGLTFTQGGHQAVVQASFVVDASGAAAVVARALGIKRRDAIRTVAIAGYWAEAKVPEGFPSTNTLFEMLPDGWVWSLLRADGLRNVTLGVDPSSIKSVEGGGAELYLEKIRGSTLVGPLLERARLVGKVEIHDATWSSAETHAGAGFLLAGDAAATIDPLTSQGVYKALQSGIVAAAAINTCLVRPEDSDLALAYYREAQEEFRRNYAEISLSFYRASPFAAEPFWRTRMRPDALAEAGIDEERIEAETARRRDFYDCVGNLGGSQVWVRRKMELHLDQRPVAAGGVIARRPVLCGRDAGWVDIGRVDPAVLLELLDGRTLSDLFEGYVARTGDPRSARLSRTLLTAIGNLAARDLIEVRTHPESDRDADPSQVQ
jgi:flavin-dependent dehydrogenase